MAGRVDAAAGCARLRPRRLIPTSTPESDPRTGYTGAVCRFQVRTSRPHTLRRAPGTPIDAVLAGAVTPLAAPENDHHAPMRPPHPESEHHARKRHADRKYRAGLTFSGPHVATARAPTSAGSANRRRAGRRSHPARRAQQAPRPAHPKATNTPNYDQHARTRRPRLNTTYGPNLPGGFVIFGSVRRDRTRCDVRLLHRSTPLIPTSTPESDPRTGYTGAVCRFRGRRTFRNAECAYFWRTLTPWRMRRRAPERQVLPILRGEGHVRE